MKQRFLLFLLVSGPMLSSAQDPAAILKIRARFNAVNTMLSKSTPQSYELSGSTEGGELLIYNLDGKLLRLTATYYGETGKWVEDYYLDDLGFPVFVFTQDYAYNRPFYYTEAEARSNGDTEWFDPEKTTVAENRYYFEDEQLIRWLDPDNREVPASHPDYGTRYTEFWEKMYAMVETSYEE